MCGTPATRVSCDLLVSSLLWARPSPLVVSFVHAVRHALACAVICVGVLPFLSCLALRHD